MFQKTPGPRLAPIKVQRLSEKLMHLHLHTSSPRLLHKDKAPPTHLLRGQSTQRWQAGSYSVSRKRQTPVESSICCVEVGKKKTNCVFISAATHHGTQQRNINLDELMSRLLIVRSHWAQNRDGCEATLGYVCVWGGGRPHFSRLTDALATTGYGLKRAAVGWQENDWIVNYISQAVAAA